MQKKDWFDGHLDLACLALMGRDMLVSPQEAQGPPQPASLTFPSMQDGGITQCIGTIFTAPNFSGPCGYHSYDAVEGAHKAGVRQLTMYEIWERTRVIDRIFYREDLEQPTGIRPQILLSMEGADPIRSPEEVGWWYEKGLRLVGMAWNQGTRYAGGNARPRPLSQEGRELVHALDQYGMIHDLSHLCDEAAWQLLEISQGPIIASHSSSRSSLQSQDQRHLPDDLIRAIGQRDGMIGLNLLSPFLHSHGLKKRTQIDDAVAQIEILCEYMGRRDTIGLGSDLDGGYGANTLPTGIQEPKDFTKICDRLAQRGWSDEEIDGFVRGNWLRFLQKHLPARPTT
ncbi:MAG: membrane dipeptidase [Myxococcales bacterium]|nr:membrane dipeptidase [Myxococcales bacterium]